MVLVLPLHFDGGWAPVKVEALRLAKEAIQEAGFEVRDVELDDSWVQHGRLSIVANIDIRGGIFAGRHSWEYCKDGVTVQAEWP